MAPENIELTLYSTEGCHLCEEAEQMLAQSPAEFNLTVVDIVDDESLVSQYGVHIPVLKSKRTGSELFWPFDGEQLEQFIRTQLKRTQ